MIDNKHLLAYILSAGLFTYGVSRVYLNLAGQNEEETQEIKVEELTDLIDNDNPDLRTIVNLDETKGIQSMLNLISINSFPESWLFLPERNLWVEYGVYIFEDNKYVALAHFDIFSEVLEENDHIVSYSIYPNRGFLDEGSYVSILPTEEHFYAMIQLSSAFYEKYPDGNITFRLCSLDGITEYWLNERGLDKFFRDKTIDYSINISKQAIYDAISSKQKRTIEDKDPYIEITFEPF